MPTCLDDLKASLDALVAALDGSLGGDAITISTRSNANANASSEAWVLNNVQVAAVAASSAVALALVEIDISVQLAQTTLIQNVMLPPVSQGTPPNLTVFPEVSTGVSDTSRPDEGPGGSLCQTVYFVIDTLQALATLLAKFPDIGYLSANILSFVVLPAVQALEFFLATKGIIIPKASLVAIQAFLAAMAAANLAVGDMLDSLAFWLATNRDELAQTIYCTFTNGASTVDVAKAVYEQVSMSLGENEAQFLALLLTPNTLAAMIFETGIFDSSGQPEEECPACE